MLFINHAKVLIFKQITTFGLYNINASQLFINHAKVLIFKQITTNLMKFNYLWLLFINHAKVLIFKQITTEPWLDFAANDSELVPHL